MLSKCHAKWASVSWSPYHAQYKIGFVWKKWTLTAREWRRSLIIHVECSGNSDFGSVHVKQFQDFLYTSYSIAVARAKAYKLPASVWWTEGALVAASTLNTFSKQEHRVGAHHVWFAAQPEWSPIAAGFRVEPSYAGCDYLSFIIYTRFMFSQYPARTYLATCFDTRMNTIPTSLKCVGWHYIEYRRDNLRAFVWLAHCLTHLVWESAFLPISCFNW